MGMTAIPTAGSILLSFSVSVGIGPLFGYMPASRAARLNPIECCAVNNVSGSGVLFTALPKTVLRPAVNSNESGPALAASAKSLLILSPDRAKISL